MNSFKNVWLDTVTDNYYIIIVPININTAIEHLMYIILCLLDQTMTNKHLKYVQLISSLNNKFNWNKWWIGQIKV